MHLILVLAIVHTLNLFRPSHSACTQYCAAGDTLSGSSCTGVMSVVVSYRCDDGYSSSNGGPCLSDPCSLGGTFCSSDYGSSNGGKCATGGYNPPEQCGSVHGCYTACGGPGGYFCYPKGTSTRCYVATITADACPGGTINADETQCRSNTPAQTVYSCADSRYSLYPNSASPTSCRRTYTASPITNQATCTSYAPSTTGCKWCANINVCVTSSSTPTCPSSCPATGQATCVIPISVCKWCPAVSGGVGGIGVCQPDPGGTCWASCLSATADPSNADVCGYSTECKWCPAAAGGVGGIGVCQPNNGMCYTTCLAASVEPSVCDTSTACQWCSTTTSIAVCQPNAATCWATCPPATDDPLASSLCSTSLSCKWCPAAAGGVGGIGVCQIKGGTCWASCLSATADPSNADVCGYSTECKWCPSSTYIGVCQPNSGTCWATCTPASDDPLSPSLCTTSLDCKWCPTLGYCTERTRDCHTLCTTVAPDEPAICQVQSIQAQCQWCGAPGSVEYCVARTDEARLRCAASCGGLIWRQDVCNGALECHWCGVHNAAQGGRCKPVPGKSRGYVAWRREVECDTASSSETATRRLTPSSTSSVSPSFTVSARLTLSLSYHDSLSFSLSNTLSITLSPSLSDNETFSRVVTVSMSRFRFTLSPKVSNTSSLSITHSKSSTSTATQQPTASRYYWRDRTLVEAVATYLAFGLMVPSVVGGMGGGAMTSSLSRVLAARNVGQCWGQSGGSVFSVPVDLCNFSSNDEDQLEGQGDAVIGAAVVLCGVVLLTSFNAAYWIWKGTSFRMASEDLSIVSVLSPLWVAAIPIVVGGAVTTAVAPMTSDHPLANTCAATAALVAVCFVLTLLLMIVLTVVPMATPALFGVACRRGKPPRNVGVTASLPKRALTWFRRSGRRWWHWEPVAVASPNSSSHRMVRTLLLEYRVLWYSALDATVVCAVSVLGSLGPFLSWTPCVATGVSVAAMFAAQLLACLVSQPMARPFDWYVCNITLALTLMSSILRVVYGASTTDEEREDRGELLIIAAVFDLMVSVVTFGPIVVDAIELLKHAASCVSRKQSTPNNSDEDRHVELLLLEDVTQAHQVDVEESCNPEGCSMDASQLVSTFELNMNGVIEEQLLEMLEENSLEPQSTVGDVVEDKLHQLITEFQQMDDDDDALLLEVVQGLEPTGVATDEGSQLRATALLEAYGNND